jgi:hypothetical protein
MTLVDIRREYEPKFGQRFANVAFPVGYNVLVILTSASFVIFLLLLYCVISQRDSDSQTETTENLDE